MGHSEICETFAVYSKLMTKVAFGIYEHNTQGAESRNSAAHTCTHKDKIGVMCGSLTALRTISRKNNMMSPPSLSGLHV